MDQYIQIVVQAMTQLPRIAIDQLEQELDRCWQGGHHVFICGNGGSAANAMHLANDFLYGVSGGQGLGLKMVALPANASVLTCLGNDCGYDQIFAYQLAVQASSDDLLIILSGSGNSPNILQALDMAQKKQMKTCGILGFDGGKSKALVDIAIHIPVEDMQVAEDMQLMIGHMLMQALKQKHLTRRSEAVASMACEGL